MPSTVIRFFSYDAARRRLTVVFRSGRRYAYIDVPQDVFDGFAAAFSKGEYFNVHIRDRFAFERIDSVQSS
jgi:hypothetical protein